MKGVADEMNRLSRPQGYGPGGPQAVRPQNSEPLVLSKRL
jgi:hypothetical protein